MFKRVVVGTDGSETAGRAVRRAAELAALGGGELHIVSAYRPMSVRQLEAARAALPAEFGWTLSEDSDVNRHLAEARHVAEEVGATTETHAESGEPADVILRVAEEREADVIVIGNRGVERRVLASVPNAVVQHAPCDVLVVRTR